MFKYKKTIYLGKKGMIIFGILMGIFVAVALWIFISAYSTPHTERIQICIKDIYGNIYINLNGEMHGYYPNEVPESLSVGDVVRYNLVVAGKPKILEITEEGNFENPEILRFEQWRDCFYINGHRLWIGPNTYFIGVSVDLFGIYNKSTDRYYVTNVYEDEFIPVPNE